MLLVLLNNNLICLQQGTVKGPIWHAVFKQNLWWFIFPMKGGIRSICLQYIGNINQILYRVIHWIRCIFIFSTLCFSCTTMTRQYLSGPTVLVPLSINQYAGVYGTFLSSHPVAAQGRSPCPEQIHKIIFFLQRPEDIMWLKEHHQAGFSHIYLADSILFCSINYNF